MTFDGEDPEQRFTRICSDRYPLEDLVEEKKEERKERAQMYYRIIQDEIQLHLKQYEMTTVLLDRFRWILLKKDINDCMESLKMVTDQWGEWIKL
jgi:hypothetical protein